MPYGKFKSFIQNDITSYEFDAVVEGKLGT